MFVRLAHAWTGPDRAQHCAGDLIEVDNVTLAELEAGGFVSTEEEEGRTTKRPDASSTDENSSTAKKGTEGGDSGTTHPDSSGWPPIG